ncbi:MAG: alpha-ketoglutarate-dependent taurine dioxygenase [Vicingaceae bacterium]|jgi:alpha-ketoglutarate-dependent taurine dioxygenase
MGFYKVYREGEEHDFKNVFSQNKVVKVESNILVNSQLGAYFESLAKRVGIPLIYEENPVTGEIIRNKWTEIKYDKLKSKNTYKHSSMSQPLHTDYGYFSFDMPVSFFYCEQQASFGGATTFIDAERIVEILELINQDLFQELQRTEIQFGRNDSTLSSRKDFILKNCADGWQINWNYFRAQNDLENKELIERFKSFLEESIEKSGELLELKLKVGEGVFFHDRKVLHGRNSFVGNRHLNKGALLFEVPDEIAKLLVAKQM